MDKEFKKETLELFESIEGAGLNTVYILPNYEHLILTPEQTTSYLADGGLEFLSNYFEVSSDEYLEWVDYWLSQPTLYCRKLKTRTKERCAQHLPINPHRVVTPQVLRDLKNQPCAFHGGMKRDALNAWLDDLSRKEAYERYPNY